MGWEYKYIHNSGEGFRGKRVKWVCSRCLGFFEGFALKDICQSGYFRVMHARGLSFVTLVYRLR